MAFSSDGKTMAVGGVNSVQLGDHASGKTRLINLPGLGTVTTVRFSARGRYLAALGEKAAIWDLNLDRLLPLNFEQYEDSDGLLTYNHLISLNFSGDEAHLALGAHQGQLYLFELNSARLRRLTRELQVAPNLMPIGHVSFSPDGRTLASAHGSALVVWRSGSSGQTGSRDGVVLLWDIPTGTLIATLSGHRAGVFFANFSMDGRWLASVSGNLPGFEQGGTEVKIWDIRSRTATQTLSMAETGYARSVSFSPDGACFAVFSHERVTLWDPLRKWKFGEFLVLL